MGKSFLLSAMVLLAIAGCKKSATTNDQEILIGQYGSMTGSEATFGLATDKGIKMAFDAKNAAGGVKGKKLKLITYDNQGKSEEAASVLKKLITQDNVVAVLGEVASTRSLFAGRVAQQMKVPMITPSSTNPKVTQVGDYVFRVCFIDTFQGTAMARFAREHLKLSRVAILKDMKSDYSLGLAEYFEKTFKELGGEIVAIEDYQSDDTDFKGQLTQIRSKKPDGIFIPGYYTGVGLIARQARQLGIKVPLLGGDGWESPKLVEIGKEAVQGSYFSTHFTAESSDPFVQDFVKKYKALYGGEVPDGLAAAGYDAALVLIDALEKAPELTPKAIRDQIAQTKDFKGVTGVITLNEKRDAVKPAVVVRVDGDGVRFVTNMNP